MAEARAAGFLAKPEGISAITEARAAGFPGSFGMEPEGDLAMSLFLSNFVHYFKQSEELPLERRRDSV